MALTNARDILNKKILGTGGGVPSADEIPIDIEGLSATKLSVGLQEIVLDIGQLSSSVLTINGEINDINEKIDDITELSTTEHVVGKWIDGSDVYEKYVDESSDPIVLTSNTWVETSEDAANIAKIIDLQCFAADGSFFGWVGCSCSSTKIKLQNVRSDSITISGFLIRYIKTPPVETKKRTTKKK